MKSISCNQEMGALKDFCAQEPHSVLFGITNRFLRDLYPTNINRI